MGYLDALGDLIGASSPWSNNILVASLAITPSYLVILGLTFFIDLS
jgi:hypothetical protein